MNKPIVIIGGIFGVIVIGIVVMARGSGSIGSSTLNPSAEGGQQEITSVSGHETLVDDDVVLGDPDAPVTLIEFGDYQCTFCTKFFKETEPSLISKYVVTGQLKLVFRDLPVNGPESVNAALAAGCAQTQGSFWKYHDRLFNERTGYNDGVFTEENLVRFAGDIGLDTDAFRTCYQNKDSAQEIAKDARDGQRIGASGTPTFFLNGIRIPGAQPLSVFENAIEQLLAQQEQPE